VNATSHFGESPANLANELNYLFAAELFAELVEEAK
jgi:hypothetical protein